MSLININNLTFYYDGSYDTVFDNVSFQLDTSWKLGLVGRNGRGKTTLFRLLMGMYEYKGTIHTSVPFEYFPYQAAGCGKDTIEVIEEVDGGYELWKVCRELSLLEADCSLLYRPFDTLSNGERTKILLAVLFAKESGPFLLIDEPTNHLDAASRDVLKQYLNQKKGFILVSHDRNFLDGCIDHVLAMNKSTIEISKGDFTTWWDNRKNRDEYEISENERLRKDIRHLTEAASRNKNWSDRIEQSKIGDHAGDRGFIGHKSAKMMKRAKAIENRVEHAIEEKSGLLKNLETAEDLKIIPLRHHKDTLVRFKDVTIGYDGRAVIENMNFTVSNGQRIVLKGRNGSGKSSILKAVTGELNNYLGTVELAGGLIISYVSQNTSWLKGNLRDFAAACHLDEALFKALLRKLDFSRVQFDKNMEAFSGGQKKKVLIAKSLCEQAHLYIWDEPLNYIDIFSRMQIEQLIREYTPTMLIVEHDSYFVEEVATSVIELT